MKKILIIDRDQFFLSCLTDFLRLEFQVQTADDGAKGSQLIQEFQPDLIVCDLNRHNLDGYQLLKTVRNQVTTAKIPFILLSCFGDWEHRDRALNLGANEYLRKPVSLRQLLSKIKNYLEIKELINI